MKWVDPAWNVLGIAPTDDLRAIRLAYAARLKKIDVEIDPGAFVALREAFEAVKRAGAPLSRPLAMEAAPARDTPSAQFGTEPPGPALTARALKELLHSRNENRLASINEAEAMLAHWRAIVSDPRIDTLAHYGSIEIWASQLIADCLPFSEPLIIPVVEYFGWLAQEGSIHALPAVVLLLRHYRILCPRAELAPPGHYLYAGWRAQNQPPNPMDLLNWSAAPHPYALTEKPRNTTGPYIFGGQSSFVYSPNSAAGQSGPKREVRPAPDRAATPWTRSLFAAIGVFVIVAIAVLAVWPALAEGR